MSRTGRTGGSDVDGAVAAPAGRPSDVDGATAVPAGRRPNRDGGATASSGPRAEGEVVARARGGKARRGAGADEGPVAGATASEWERAAVRAQLGRPPRAMRAVAAWCPCGLPDVVETAPRLAGGAPFPTLYYLTCPRAASAIGRLEAGGVMRDMTERLRADRDLAGRYRAAHEAYLRRRDEIEPVPEIDGVSAGGMPTRVKCLHVLVGHALAAGPGANPLGDEALDLLPPWWSDGPCVPPPPGPGRPESDVDGVGGAGGAGERA